MVQFLFKHRRIFIAIFGVIILILIFKPFTPPSSFPSQSIVSVEDGVGLYDLADKLSEDKVIRSPFWFRIVAIILGGERRMKAGEYYMSRPQNVFSIAWRILDGDHDIATVKLTIPEGFTVDKISSLFDERFTLFDNKAFIASAPEGYLFPDTYFIPLSATASSTIKLLRANFDRKIFGTLPSIEVSKHSLEEIIIMASLLEAEANNKTDREMASDILWKRLKLGMPLQVDSEMGTYEFAGLPESPINNPGLESIDAAIHPTTTPYLYFLTGDDGEMHYSRTFEEHVAKKLKYIKQS